MSDEYKEKYKTVDCTSNTELWQEIRKLRSALEVAANQLEGVSLAIKAHGQNINVDFFTYEYAEMAKKARELIK